MATPHPPATEDHHFLAPVRDPAATLDAATAVLAFLAETVDDGSPARDELVCAANALRDARRDLDD